ncbi:MAG: biopolymer transporter ExbD [Candidatus Krumholzibacteria bacterium]|nr:biopolymer transporter ExbD [Candidatus Krumholzibacteria bacterium]
MSKRKKIHIDMTPMVDVAFLLLIFFMTTTQFKPPEQVAVQLPRSRSQIHIPDTGTIILTVNRTGQMFISSAVATDTQELAPDNVVDAIVAWRGRNPSAIVVLKADKDADFGVIADLMDALAEAKTMRFNLMTDLKKRARPAEIELSAPESSTP